MAAAGGFKRICRVLMTGGADPHAINLYVSTRDNTLGVGAPVVECVRVAAPDFFSPVLSLMCSAGQSAIDVATDKDVERVLQGTSGEHGDDD